MPTLTVKNIPEELYERLKQSALEHRRSINSEIIVCLERSLYSERVDVRAQLARLDALRSRAALSPVTDGLINEARARMARSGQPPAGEEAPAGGAPERPRDGASDGDDSATSPTTTLPFGP